MGDFAEPPPPSAPSAESAHGASPQLHTHKSTAKQLTRITQTQKCVFVCICDWVCVYNIGVYSRYLLHLGQLPPRMLVVAQVLLVPHQDDGNVGAEVLHLRGPLLRNVLWKDERKPYLVESRPFAQRISYTEAVQCALQK